MASLNETRSHVPSLKISVLKGKNLADDNPELENVHKKFLGFL